MKEETRPTEVTCARCGSAHLAWRVKRSGGTANGPTRRTILWSCRDCGGEEVACAEEPSPASAERQGELRISSVYAPTPGV